MKRLSYPLLATISAGVALSFSSALAAPFSLDGNRYRTADEIFSGSTYGFGDSDFFAGSFAERILSRHAGFSLLNPKSRLVDANYIVDEASDTNSSDTSINDGASPFNVQLFGSVSTLGNPSGSKSVTTIAADGGAGVLPAGTSYLWGGANNTNWNVTTNWTPNTDYPNAVGDTASNAQSANTVVVQNTSGGVTVGTIGQDAVNVNNNWTVTATTAITLNQDGAGPLSATIRNTDASATASNFLSINGAVGLSLADNLSVTNSGGSTANLGSIRLGAPIAGSGAITFNNVSNNASAGEITIGGANTFTGTSTIASGAVTFGSNSAFGQATNAVNLGTTTGSAATLLASSQLTLPNNITAAASTGTLVLGSNSVSQVNYGGTLTLNGNITLTSGSTVSSNAARTVAYTNTISGAGAVNTTGTSSSVGFTSFTTGNTYQGGTTVSSGTLLVNNGTGTSGTGSGAVTINNSGTLGGTGFINAGANNVTINGGGNITAGSNGAVASTGAVGALTLTASNVLFSGTAGNLATYIVDLTSTASDKLTINGNLNLSTTFDQLLFQGPTGASSYTIATYTGSLTGTFDTANTPTGYFVNYANPNVISLDVTPAPEPSTWAAGVLAFCAVGYTQRRRFARFATRA